MSSGPFHEYVMPKVDCSATAPNRLDTIAHVLVARVRGGAVSLFTACIGRVCMPNHGLLLVHASMALGVV